VTGIIQTPACWNVRDEKPATDDIDNDDNGNYEIIIIHTIMVRCRMDTWTLMMMLTMSMLMLLRRDGVAIYPSLAMLRTATTGLRSEARDTELLGEARPEAMRVSSSPISSHAGEGQRDLRPCR